MQINTSTKKHHRLLQSLFSILYIIFYKISEKNIFTTQHKEYYDRHSIIIGMFVKIQIPQNYPSLIRRFAPCFFKRREARRRRRDTISVKGPSIPLPPQPTTT